MKKALLILTLLFFLMGCNTGTNAKNSPQDITPAEAKELLEADSSVVIIDVRTQSEYDAGHIPNAVLLPLDEISNSAAQIMPNLNTTYIIYCRSGNRSAQAVTLLDQMGYTDLYDLGGIIDWPYDIVN